MCAILLTINLLCLYHIPLFSILSSTVGCGGDNSLHALSAPTALSACSRKTGVSDHLMLQADTKMKVLTDCRLVYVLYKKEQHVWRAYFYPFKGRCSEDWRGACSVAFKVKACLVPGVENLQISNWIHSKMWFAYCYLTLLCRMMYEQSLTLNKCFNIPLLKRESLPVRSLNHVHASMISCTIYTTGIQKPEISST